MSGYLMKTVHLIPNKQSMKMINPFTMSLAQPFLTKGAFLQEFIQSRRSREGCFQENPGRGNRSVPTSVVSNKMKTNVIRTSF